jgi:LysM repeat protein
LLRQVEGARELAYASREADVDAMVAAGTLVRVRGNGDYELKSSNPWPYARPEVVRFLENLGRGYREACGERLVVTSLVRPRNRQPRNASPMSVHPTGTAVDLRMHWRRQCRSWLEGELAALEDAGVLEAGRELRPPHYHVAVFPRAVLAHLGEETAAPVLASLAAGPPPADTWPPLSEYRYVVQRGDTLWGISRRYGVDAAALRAANGLSSSNLRIGQQLRVPVVGGPAGAPSPEPAEQAVYRVRPGDNLWRIALRYGTVVGLIQQVNGLSSTRIFPGQVLQIPGAGR